MNLIVNGAPRELADAATVADLLRELNATPPFAVAVNTTFIPAAQHAAHILQAGDRVEVISPVTGG